MEPVDLTEKSLLEAIEQIKLKPGERIAIKPTKYIVPPWVKDKIIAEFGEATTENFWHWKIKHGV